MIEKKKPVIFKRIQVMLLKKATPDGKIDRNKLFEVIAERVGKIEYQEREVLVYELQTYGIIKQSDRLSFILSKEV